MNNSVSYLKLIGLVSRARIGDQESMSQLAEVVQGRLLTYIYRLTLNYDLAQDLLQETLLEMVKSLKELRKVDRFWAWLFRTALSKVQHHFRDQRRKRTVQMSMFDEEYLLKRTSQDGDDGLSKLIREELSDAIFEAMKKVKVKHRNVLVLRCLEQMPYSEIATIMDCNELKARVLFFRAKHSLKKRLSQRGFGRGLLLMSLTLFGIITTPAKATSVTSTVSAASVDVGFPAAVIGFLGTNLGIAVATVVAAITLTLVIKAVLYVTAFICAAFFLLVLACLIKLYD